MRVTGITIDKFTAFEHVEVEFSPGLNVFIGANATGKSHLLKLLYTYLKTGEIRSRNQVLSPNDFEQKLREKLGAVFRPDDNRVGRLPRRTVGRTHAAIRLRFSNRQVTSFEIDTRDAVSLHDWGLASPPRMYPSIFIPSREALAMFEGFVGLYHRHELAFDETYNDLCVALSAPVLRGPRGAGIAQLAKPLEEILGGPVRLRGSRFYVESKEGILEAHLLAEGLRKIASLAYLINNGSLVKNSCLFWDEPEANLNPQLVTRVGEVLRKLVKGGVQVFIATHDYLLSHELSLAVEYRRQPVVDTRFFAFSRASETDPVTIESGDTLADLEHNPILEEFVRHYERERDQFFLDPGRKNGGAT